MPKLKVYVREPVDRRTYPSALAQSIHFAISISGETFEPLNNNYGILFPEAEISAENTILERGAASPRIARCGEYVYFIADYVDADGEIVYPDRKYVWCTWDFKKYRDLGLADHDELPFDPSSASDTLTVSTDELCALMERFLPLKFSHIELPERVFASMLEKTEAMVVYTDGSCSLKKVNWTVDADGRHAHGEIMRNEFPFPLARGFADPVIFSFGGAWYFLATNDNTGDVGLYIRRAETPEGLFADGCEPNLILPYDEARGFVQTFWAPEFHEIGGEYYILLAIGGKQWSPHSHMMKLKKGCDPFFADSWEGPVRVVRADGGDLAPGMITLDMTYFKLYDAHYLCWSQRRYGPDTGSMLAIAETDGDEPWRLKTEPVVISRPLYGWENQSGTVNNEGPYPLFVRDKLYLTYSGGAAGGYSYVVGFLELEPEQDPLDPDSWHKSVCPECSSFMFTDREGPGHNSFFTDAEWNTYFVCHAQLPGEDSRRNTSITRMHINGDGRPTLALPPSEDLPAGKEFVSIEII